MKAAPCDPFLADYLVTNPQYAALAVREPGGRATSANLGFAVIGTPRLVGPRGDSGRRPACAPVTDDGELACAHGCLVRGCPAPLYAAALQTMLTIFMVLVPPSSPVRSPRVSSTRSPAPITLRYFRQSIASCSACMASDTVGSKATG